MKSLVTVFILLFSFLANAQEPKTMPVNTIKLNVLFVPAIYPTLSGEYEHMTSNNKSIVIGGGYSKFILGDDSYKIRKNLFAEYRFYLNSFDNTVFFIGPYARLLKREIKYGPDSISSIFSDKYNEYEGSSISIPTGLTTGIKIKTNKKVGIELPLRVGFGRLLSQTPTDAFIEKYPKSRNEKILNSLHSEFDIRLNLCIRLD